MRSLALPLLALLAATTLASAQDRACVLVIAPSERALTRLRGQTADLPVELRTTSEPVANDFLERAIALAEAEGAAYAVRLEEHDDGAITVSIVEVAERRLFARRIDAPEGERSATMEAAALVARAALSDLARGGHVGVVVPAPPAAAPASAAPPAAAPPAPAPVPEPPPEGAELPLRVLGAFGAAIAIDGLAPLANLGVGGGLQVDLGIVEIGVGASLGVPGTLGVPPVELGLTRIGIRAGLGLELASEPEVRVVVAIEGGAALLIRQSRALSPELEATATTLHALPLVGLSARAQITPLLRNFGFPLGIFIEVGADVLPTAPRFVVQAGDATLAVGDVWPVQPRATLGIALRSP